MPPTCGHAFPHLCGAVSAALVGGLLAQLADGVVGAFGGLATVGCRRAETTAAAAASRLGQHLACVFMDGYALFSYCGLTRLSAQPRRQAASRGSKQELKQGRQAPPPLSVQ